MSNDSQSESNESNANPKTRTNLKRADFRYNALFKILDSKGKNEKISVYDFAFLWCGIWRECYYIV